MASLLSSTEKSTLTGILGDHFDTFKEDIVVYQKPIKLATDINIDFLYGYGPVSNPTNYSYTQVSGVFSALINRGGAPKDDNYLRDAISYQEPTEKLFLTDINPYKWCLVSL